MNYSLLVLLKTAPLFPVVRRTSTGETFILQPHDVEKQEHTVDLKKERKN